MVRKGPGKQLIMFIKGLLSAALCLGKSATDFNPSGFRSGKLFLRIRRSGRQEVALGPHHLKNIEFKGGDENQVFLFTNFLQSQGIACRPGKYSVETRELTQDTAGVLKEIFRTQNVPPEILSHFDLFEDGSARLSQGPPVQDFQI